MTEITAALWIAQGSGGESLLLNLVPMLAIFAIFWFLLVAPMRRQQKQKQKMIEELKRGDKVVTTGGVYGDVAAVDSGTVVLKVADNLKIKVAKNAIAGLQGETDGGEG